MDGHLDSAFIAKVALSSLSRRPRGLGRQQESRARAPQSQIKVKCAWGSDYLDCTGPIKRETRLACERAVRLHGARSPSGSSSPPLCTTHITQRTQTPTPISLPDTRNNKSVLPRPALFALPPPPPPPTNTRCSHTSPPAPLQPAVRFRNNTLIVDSSSRQHPAFLTRSSECPLVLPSDAQTHTQSHPSVHISICPRARSHPPRSTSLPQLHRLSHRHAADHPPIRQTSYSSHAF